MYEVRFVAQRFSRCVFPAIGRARSPRAPGPLCALAIEELAVLPSTPLRPLLHEVGQSKITWLNYENYLRTIKFTHLNNQVCHVGL
jgi:hypothetical protein